MTRGEVWRLVRIALGCIGLWLLVALFSTSEFVRRIIAMGGVPPPLGDTLQFQIVSALNWAVATPIVVFIAERLPLRGPRGLRNTLLLIPLVPALAATRAIIGGAVMNLVEDGFIKPGFLALSLGVRFHYNIFVLVVIITITNVVLAQAEEVARERRTIELETAATTATIEDMRARLQPQFLFATLESIEAQIRTAPATADRMIVALSYLLRRSLDFAQRDDIALADELAFIENYLVIQRQRFESLTARIDVDDEMLAARVRPFLLQPFVDDAVINGMACGSGSVDISGRASGSLLRLEVRGIRSVALEVPLVLPEAEGELKRCAS